MNGLRSPIGCTKIGKLLVQTSMLKSKCSHPYEEINKEQYDELLDKFKNMDFAQIVSYEKYDETEAKKELACAGGACELN